MILNSIVAAVVVLSWLLRAVVISYGSHIGAEDGEVIDDEATHIIVQATVVRAEAFMERPNIVKVIFHEGVEKIEEWAFGECYSLRRVIMLGVKVAEESAFDCCEALQDVECDELEIIGQQAFCCCESLRSINLPSARIVRGSAFANCYALTDVEFGDKLERIEEEAFENCSSLERITIPFNDGFITDDNIFRGCHNLRHVDLIGGELDKTIASLQLEEWRNDMNIEIDSINQILPQHGLDGGMMMEGIREKRHKRYEGGSDQFFTRLFITNTSIKACYTRLQLHSSLSYQMRL